MDRNGNVRDKTMIWRLVSTYTTQKEKSNKKRISLTHQNIILIFKLRFRRFRNIFNCSCHKWLWWWSIKIRIIRVEIFKQKMKRFVCCGFVYGEIVIQVNLLLKKTVLHTILTCYKSFFFDLVEQIVFWIVLIDLWTNQIQNKDMRQTDNNITSRASDKNIDCLYCVRVHKTIQYHIGC